MPTSGRKTAASTVAGSKTEAVEHVWLVTGEHRRFGGHHVDVECRVSVECRTKVEKRGNMPKFKPHSGTAKRVRITGKGKIRREQAGRRHYLEHKSSRLTRRLAGTTELADQDVPRIKRMLGR